jgi:hypothetical protein
VAQPATRDGRLKCRLLVGELGETNVQAKQGGLGFWVGCARSPAIDASAFPNEVRSVGSAVEKTSLGLSLEVEERSDAQAFRSSAT